LNTQGKGAFSDSLKRYKIESPGVFLASSKNYKFLGYLSLHGMLNYSFENKDGDENINFGAGLEKTIGPFISIIAEYNFALNDNSKNSFGDSKGYLNLGIRISAAKGLTLGIDFRDMLDNSNLSIQNGSERSVYIEYISLLF